MIALLARVWRALSRRSSSDRLPDVDEAIDVTPPEDVEPLAAYLWAMCWDKPGREPADYALAAVAWLNFGLLMLPSGSAPLDAAARRALPVPYEDRAAV